MSNIKDVLIGTAIGDIAGSRFELNNCKTGKDFVLLHDQYCRYTDDTVMTFAIAKALVNCDGNLKTLEKNAIDSMVKIGRDHINCGFGPSFYYWLKKDEHNPYGSYGNGSAMRISPVAVVFKDLKDIKKASACITNLSHNHEDSIMGSEAVCVSIYMALNNYSKDEIINHIENNYFKLDAINKKLKSQKEININCVETVKKSLIAFKNSINFEDAIRNAIALGGDSDTIGAITGSIASAYYGIPKEIYNHALNFLSCDLKDVHREFKKYINESEMI